MLSDLSLSAVSAIFVAAAAVVLLAGVRITGLADRIADKTGIGEAMIGGVLLGATTSLSGTIVSATSALDGRASLAFSNGVGGIAAQTAFLALADVIHRRSNLEHASAELTNIFQCGLLLVMLSLPMVAFATPGIELLAVHPVSVILIVVYLLGLRATARVKDEPMWTPVRTSDTRADTPDEEEDKGSGMVGAVLRLAGLALVLGVAGFALAKSGGRLSDQLGVSETAVGALLTAVVTSLPELVTTLVAVRRGALQLAVGGIIGGNSFDVLFLSLSDIFYREGSLYHAVGKGDLFWLTIGLTMSGIILLGLIMRERRGPANIGFESVSILGLYFGAVGLQILLG